MRRTFLNGSKAAGPWDARRDDRTAGRLFPSLAGARASALVLAASMVIAVPPAAACPRPGAASAGASTAGAQLVVSGVGIGDFTLDSAALAALPATTLTVRQSVGTGTGADGAVLAESGVSYTGVLLRDVLRAAGFDGPNDRSARAATIEATATDGYRAVFSWGELFNTPLGEQVLVIRLQDGRPLSAGAGPLALRPLGDQRPGPRHVRNLCGLVVRR